MTAKKVLRCAIYTRKSTEEGLEQEFNSLDAQHEACAAYVASQIGLGWKLVADRYDDGGISGGTMERPALKRLLADMEAGRIDIVVVYKIDRLTRSLTDFARMVEIFDRHQASFVSITQQFNTTTSMGRLTLNVLLSFAQFEREVTAERIRDKVAASKKKGMWMGGTIPLGYRVESKKLIVDETAATHVRRLFDRYLELGSVPGLARELNREGGEEGSAGTTLLADNGQGRRPAAQTIGKGKLYYMLSNPIYIGKIRHGGEVYEGEHQPIVSLDTFERVQAKLADQAPREKGKSVSPDIHLLGGLLYDESGDRMSPIHATKAGKRYRYYISARLKGGKAGIGNASGGWRIPANEIEPNVLKQCARIFADAALLTRWLQDAEQAGQIESALAKTGVMHAQLTTAQSPDHLRALLQVMVRRVTLRSDCIQIAIDRQAVVGVLLDPSVVTSLGGKVTSNELSRSAAGRAASDDHDHLHVIDLPIAIRQRGVERRLVIEGQGAVHVRRDQPLIDALARSHAYLEAMNDGSGLSRKDVARRFGVHPEDVSRLLPLAFLSPEIVTAILAGQQPADLSVRHLTRDIILPVSWTEQQQLVTG